MDPDRLNYVILRIHVDKNNHSQPCHLSQNSVSARYGSKKIKLLSDKSFRRKPKRASRVFLGLSMGSAKTRL